jgi:hypothetical protein
MQLNVKQKINNEFNSEELSYFSNRLKKFNTQKRIKPQKAKKI